MIKLVLPTVEYKDSYIEAVKEYQAEGRYMDESIDGLEKDFRGFVKREREQSEGKNLPEGYVPMTIFWAIDDNGKFVGKISIRHYLNDALKQIGGHIGYDVRPSARQKGYGKEMLRLVLPEAKKLGLERVFLTCDETNIGSKKIIESNGGVLQDVYEYELNKPKKLRYWIEIK